MGTEVNTPDEVVEILAVLRAWQPKNRNITQAADIITALQANELAWQERWKKWISLEHGSVLDLIDKAERCEAAEARCEKAEQDKIDANVENDKWRVRCQVAESGREAAEAKCVGLEKDAARYRHFRKDLVNDNNAADDSRNWIYKAIDSLTEDDLDNTIDAALAAQKG